MSSLPLLCPDFVRRRWGSVIAGLLLGWPGTLQAAVDPGEILLSEMNCVACHDASGPVKDRLASRQAPLLGAAGMRITPHHLQAFLENPVATKTGTLMPDLLHALEPAEKTAAAEALTHYLVSLQTPDTRPPAGASAATVELGQELYHTVGCVQCHAPQALPKETSAKVEEEFQRLQRTSTPLGKLAEKYTVNDLAQFLQDPVKVRPSGRMPGMKLDAGEARAIAMYLLRDQMPAAAKTQLTGLQYEYYEAELPELPQFDRLTPKTTGKTAYFTLQVAERKNDYALRFRGLLKIETEGEYRFLLRSDDGSRLFIDGRKVVENGGAHPTQERSGTAKLKPGLHTIEVVYFDAGGPTDLGVDWKLPNSDKKEKIPERLLSHEGQPMRPVGETPLALDPAKAARGQDIYTTLNCAGCHQIDAPGRKARPMDKLIARQPAGCLATKPAAHVPKFDLTDRQRVVLLAGLQSQAIWLEPLEPDDLIKRTMTTLNCYACHQRGRRGGIDGMHREYLTAVGEVDLGDEGRVPPHLNAVGAKLRPEWIKEVLINGASVRPYMATRMPQFGEANVGKLPHAFDQADIRPEAAPDPNPYADNASEQAKWGRKLLGTTGLSCIACHNFAGNKSLGIPAIDLANAAQRLKYDWFHRYLVDPQSLRPGTRMPSFWPGGVATKRDILNGETDAQIRALWLYAARKNFTDLPDGLIQGKQEIVATDEAVIYRNFIDGGGPRAIGVGYPEKVNLAFDADHLRLALIWQGSFIDAAKHFTGRGQGFEKPLGHHVVSGPPGAPLAVLASQSEPWPAEETRAAGYQFHGYRLDEKRRPAFRYTFHQIEVEDYPLPVPPATGVGDPSLRRTITLRGTNGTENLYFRAAVGGKIVEQDGSFVVDEKLRLTFPGAKPLIRTSENKSELLVPVSFANGNATIVEELRW